VKGRVLLVVVLLVAVAPALMVGLAQSTVRVVVEAVGQLVEDAADGGGLGGPAGEERR